jgi:TolA-binding protein
MLISKIGFTQRTSIYTNIDAGYKKAMELYQKEKYSAAQREFQHVLLENTDPFAEVKMNAEFYVAMCSFKLFNKDAEELFISFMKRNPHSPMVKDARFYLGIFNYRKQNWSRSVEWFEQVRTHDLSAEQVKEFNFKLGYSYLMKGDSAKAQTQLYTAKQEESEYKIPALFYYSHLEYTKGNYETALIGFEQLKGDADFGPIVPYYISQIYYLQRKYRELVDYATPLLDSAKPARMAEISRLIGDGHYALDEYAQALPYLKKYVELTNTSNNDDLYQLAFCLYKVGQYEEAIKIFQKVVDKSTAIGQMSLYYLGDCYMKTNNKEAARGAFRFASKGDFDTVIAENSTFNYAKLSYELSIDPYHEAIYALEDFIRRFPNSPRIDDARRYLLEVYLTTNDYRQAIMAIDKIQRKTPQLNYAYQRIAYYRAIEVFNDEKVVVAEGNAKQNFIEAIYYFNKSLAYPVDPKITAQSYYWKGEAYYRLGRVDSAILSYNKFLASPAASSLSIEKEVYYNMGYCYFDKKDYKTAAEAFRKYFAENERLRSHKMNDALIKSADCYLLMHSYTTASAFYQKAMENGNLRGDYVLNNLAYSYELSRRPTDQADVLISLITKYPQSPYVDDAKFKIGEIYTFAGKNEDAIKYYSKVINEHGTNAELVQKAYEGIGSIYRAQSKNAEAMTYYEKAIKENPSSSLVKPLLEIYKDLCVAAGTLERYEVFTGSVGGPTLGSFEKDSLVYAIAINKYIADDFKGAQMSFQDYLNQFPSGFFAVDAHFFLAECLYVRELYDNALPHYLFVIEKPRAEHTEVALYKAAGIYQWLKKFDEAIKYFSSLEEISQVPAYEYEAQLSLMRDYAKMQNHEKAIMYAQKVLKNQLSNDAEKQEANMVLGRNHLALFDWSAAKQHFDAVLLGGKNEMAAEARYSLAYILYVQMRYDESIDAIYDFAKKFGNYKTWVSKGLILLSDDFLAKGDKFQAKYALESVINNYKGDDATIIPTAKEKMKAIEDSEKPVETGAPQESEIIIHGGNNDLNQVDPQIENSNPTNIQNNGEGK